MRKRRLGEGGKEDRCGRGKVGGAARRKEGGFGGGKGEEGVKLKEEGKEA